MGMNTRRTSTCISRECIPVPIFLPRVWSALVLRQVRHLMILYVGRRFAFIIWIIYRVRYCIKTDV